MTGSTAREDIAFARWETLGPPTLPANPITTNTASTATVDNEEIHVLRAAPGAGAGPPYVLGRVPLAPSPQPSPFVSKKDDIYTTVSEKRAPPSTATLPAVFPSTAEAPGAFRVTSLGSGVYDRGVASADSELERLAGQAEQAAAAREGPAPRQDPKKVAKGGGSNTTLAGGSSGFATGSGTIHERDESVVAAGSGVGTDGARLADLCREDKAKVARLMQDLVKLRGEKDGFDARLARLRGQNEDIVKEMASLKVKFGQSMQLLRKYQSIVQEGEAAAGGGLATPSGATAASSNSAATAAAAAETAAAADIRLLREALHAAEESAQRAEKEAAEERARRVMVDAELWNVKRDAEGLRRQFQTHINSSGGKTVSECSQEGAATASDGLLRATSVPAPAPSVAPLPPTLRHYPEPQSSPARDNHHETAESGVRAPIIAQPAPAFTNYPAVIPAASGASSTAGTGTRLGDRRADSTPEVLHTDSILATGRKEALPAVAVVGIGSSKVSSGENRRLSLGSDEEQIGVSSSGGFSDTQDGKGLPRRTEVEEAGGVGGGGGGGGREGIVGRDDGDVDVDVRAATGTERSPAQETSVAPEALVVLQKQVEVLKQELAMVSVRQLAITGIPTGDALLRSVRAGSGGSSSEGNPQPPFHDIPPSPDGSSSYGTMSEGISGSEDEASECLSSTFRPAPAGVLSAEPRSRSRTASGEAQPPGHDDTPRSLERELTDGRDRDRERYVWESASDSEDEVTVRIGHSGSMGKPRGRERKKKGEGASFDDESSGSGSDEEDEVGWWARSADDLLLAGEGDAKTNRTADRKSGTSGTVSPKHGASNGRGKERPSATIKPLGYGLDVSDETSRSHRHPPLRQRNTSVSPRDGAVVARRPHTWFEAGEGRLGSAKRGPAQSDAAGIIATGGSSRRHQQRDFEENPPTDGGGGELYPPRVTAHPSDRVGLRVSWGSNVSSVVNGPSESGQSEKWAGYGTDNATGQRSRLSQAGVRTNSGVSGDVLLQRTQQYRGGSGVMPPAGHFASKPAVNGMSARTERANSSRVRGRPWKNTTRSGEDKGPRRPGPPQRPSLPAPALRSRDGGTETNEPVARGYGEGIVANKSGRILREDAGVITSLVTEGNRTGAWGKGVVEAESMDTRDLGGRGRSGSNGRGIVRKMVATVRGNEDVGVNGARSARWDARYKEVLPAPAGKSEMLAATGSDSLFDGSLLELIDDLEEEGCETQRSVDPTDSDRHHHRVAPQRRPLEEPSPFLNNTLKSGTRGRLPPARKRTESEVSWSARNTQPGLGEEAGALVTRQDTRHQRRKEAGGTSRMVDNGDRGGRRSFGVEERKRDRYDGGDSEDGEGLW